MFSFLSDGDVFCFRNGRLAVGYYSCAFTLMELGTLEIMSLIKLKLHNDYN